MKLARLRRRTRSAWRHSTRHLGRAWAGRGHWTRRLRRSPALLSSGLCRIGRRTSFPSRLATPLGRSVLSLSALTLFIGGTWGITQSTALDVDAFSVSGAFQVTAEEAVAATAIALGTALVDVDTGAAERSLRRIPWVARAEVERSFPNRIDIRLVERTAAAFAVRPGGTFALLDPTGRVLADRPTRPVRVPEVSGLPTVPAPGGWQRAAIPALRVVAVLPGGLRRQVASVSVEATGVRVQLGGRPIAFGPPVRLEHKVAALEAILGRLGDRLVDGIDVSVPSAPVVDPLGAVPPEPVTGITAGQGPAPAATPPAPRD